MSDLEALTASYMAACKDQPSDWNEIGYWYFRQAWDAAIKFEREACAKACEARIDRLVEMKAAKFADGSAYYDHHVLNGDIGCLTDIAAAIRARSEQGSKG